MRFICFTQNRKNITYSANQSNIQIQVTGWKKYASTDAYDLYYNDTLVRLTGHVEAYAPTALDSWPGMPIPSSLRPYINCTAYSHQANVLFYVGETESYVMRKSLTGSVINLSGQKFYFQMIWERK